MRYRVAPIVLFVTACGAPATPAREASTTIDSGGVTIVTSRAPLWKPGEGWQVDSTPTTVIGADERDPEQQFKYVRTAVRLSDGRVVVITDAGIRQFSPDGRFVRAISRTGEGPGEFRYPAVLLRLAGDSIQVGQAEVVPQLATFTAEGRFVHESRTDLARYRALGRWGECAVGIFPDGSSYTCQSDSTIPITATNRPNRMIGEGMTSPGPGLLRQLNRIYLVPRSLDTAYALSIGSGIEQFGVKLAGGREAFITHPFYSYTRLAAGGSPMRIAIATNPSYQVDLWSPSGRLVRIIRRVSGRRVATVAEREGSKISVRETIARYGFDPVTSEQVFAAIPTPDSLPAIYNLTVTPDGALMVQRDGWLVGQSASHFDLFDPTGRWLGEMQLPRRVRILEAGRDYLLVLRMDDQDLSRVEVYHLRR